MHISLMKTFQSKIIILQKTGDGRTADEVCLIFVSGRKVGGYQTGNSAVQVQKELEPERRLTVGISKKKAIIKICDRERGQLISQSKDIEAMAKTTTTIFYKNIGVWVMVLEKVEVVVVVRGWGELRTQIMGGR